MESKGEEAAEEWWLSSRPDRNRTFLLGKWRHDLQQLLHHEAVVWEALQGGNLEEGVIFWKMQVKGRNLQSKATLQEEVLACFLQGILD